MINIIIGGVPEHFNLPWRELISSGVLTEAGIAARWEDYPSGTGAMASALDDEALDIAMLLTEGAVSAIARGSTFRIVSLYTQTPLIWGIHVPARSAFHAVEDIRGARYAISRLGSGSHLMCYAHARARGWPVSELRFETVGDLSGAVAAFEAGKADAFLWEKFMTKPVVDAGHFRRIGEFAAPWPAFVICASRGALREKREALAILLGQIFPQAAALRAAPNAAARFAERYGLAIADAAEWLAATRWAPSPGIAPGVVDDAADALAAVGLLERDPAETFTARFP